MLVYRNSNHNQELWIFFCFDWLTSHLFSLQKSYKQVLPICKCCSDKNLQPITYMPIKVGSKRKKLTRIRHHIRHYTINIFIYAAKKKNPTYLPTHIFGLPILLLVKIIIGRIALDSARSGVLQFLVCIVGMSFYTSRSTRYNCAPPPCYYSCSLLLVELEQWNVIPMVQAHSLSLGTTKK